MSSETRRDVTLRSFFRLSKRESAGAGTGLTQPRRSSPKPSLPRLRLPLSGLPKPLRLGKRVDDWDFPARPAWTSYLAVEGVGDELPELRFSGLRDMLTPR